MEVELSAFAVLGLDSDCSALPLSNGQSLKENVH